MKLYIQNMKQEVDLDQETISMEGKDLKITLKTESLLRMVKSPGGKPAKKEVNLAHLKPLDTGEMEAALEDLDSTEEIGVALEDKESTEEMGVVLEDMEITEEIEVDQEKEMDLKVTRTAQMDQVR